MNLYVIAIGERLPDWAEAACAEYVRRLPRPLQLHIRALRAQRGSGLAAPQVRAGEGQRLLASCPKGARRIALDEHGRQLSTRELAELLAQWMASGRDVAFFIGGAEGLDAAVLNQAELTLALSRLTLPHALARVLLVEQLYRAASLIQGHPYHRE